MNLSKDKVTEIFYFADNFCKEFHKSIEAHAIEESGKARREPRRKSKMSSGEVITIMVLLVAPTAFGWSRRMPQAFSHSATSSTSISTMCASSCKASSHRPCRTTASWN